MQGAARLAHKGTACRKMGNEPGRPSDRFRWDRKRQTGHRADRTAGLAVPAQSLIQDRLDRTRAPSALRAAAKAAIDLARGPRPLGMAGGPDGLVGQYVTGTNDHNAQVARRVG